MTSGENSIGRGWIAIAALAGLLSLAAFAPAAATAGSISGTVTDAVTLEPVESLEVCAYLLEEEEEGSEVWFCEETDSNGEYTIAGLEAGEYGVEFWGRPLNYIPQYFDGKSAWWEWDPVVVGADDVAGIDAAMVEGGGIEGTVARAGGTPVDQAFVCAWEIASEEFGGCAETESNGKYRIGGMPEGEYEVEFWAEEQDLLTQYYDHKDHWWEANPVTVSLGATTPEIDADLLALNADLGAGPPPPPVVTPPTTTPPVVVRHHRKRCKKGFRKKRAHGKVRCVKKKRKHHPRHVHGRPPVQDRVAFRRGR